MLLITFPDGTKKYYAEGTTLAEIGREVEAGYDSPLAAGVFNGQEYSLSYRVTEDGEVAFIPMNL